MWNSEHLYFPSSIMSLLKLPIIKLDAVVPKISDIKIKIFSLLHPLPQNKGTWRVIRRDEMRWTQPAVVVRKSNENRYRTAFIELVKFYEISISIIISPPVVQKSRNNTEIESMRSRHETEKTWMQGKNRKIELNRKRRTTQLESKYEKWNVNWPRTIGYRVLHDITEIWKTQSFVVGKSKIIDFSLLSHSLKYLLVFSLKFQPLWSGLIGKSCSFSKSYYTLKMAQQSHYQQEQQFRYVEFTKSPEKSHANFCIVKDYLDLGRLKQFCTIWKLKFELKAKFICSIELSIGRRRIKFTDLCVFSRLLHRSAVKNSICR